MKNCKNCEYYDAGLCRRYSPRILWSMVPGTVQSDDLNFKGVWPEVDPGEDWCGEFKTKKVGLS
jgi:hypothetical protein